MGAIEAKLKAMGYTLPQPRKFPSPNRCGCGPWPDRAAKSAALTILATVKAEVGDVDNVQRVIRLFGMVKSSPNSGRHPEVIDGASYFLFELFGPERGCHTRSAVGVADLSRGQAVEINDEFELFP
jgi:hypothetical protein